jgi:hypothetical protein
MNMRLTGFEQRRAEDVMLHGRALEATISSYARNHGHIGSSNGGGGRRLGRAAACPTLIGMLFYPGRMCSIMGHRSQGLSLIICKTAHYFGAPGCSQVTTLQPNVLICNKGWAMLCTLLSNCRCPEGKICVACLSIKHTSLKMPSGQCTPACWLRSTANRTTATGTLNWIMMHH